ncbi:copper chaperone PCu(A)C [Chthonobacter rhizosphaerae]|uniref:copper chaperone PCu(A)C n=1 Tax=Chthonobacter rhizosphaerae TaxID=2735553 RepID=UPI0015EF88DB|nr:copper chaperone PCu(A)C [Chthonobacter rhizosphaerae]
MRLDPRALALALAVAVAPAAFAQSIQEAPVDLPSVRVGDLEFVAPWSRATPPGGKVGAGYLVIRNHGAKPAVLTGGSVPFAQRVELHVMGVKDGYMQMQKTDTLEVPPGGELELKPGGPHVMFVGLTQALRVGNAYDMTLSFADGTSATVKAVVWDVGLMRTEKKS